ncbi:MAG: DNA polymerase III subunit gamma/tau [Acidimicrobiales bacterium]|jgi:DNA polymerase-3 subunit gamma/tau
MVDYQSLYRRYRPQRFAEVRGQDHVVMALSHAVRDNRVAHAYLFSGPRGTGKTSTARILAKALNCERPVEGEPCGVCDSCVDITRGASFDVHELDAASNNGVDAMRDLVARASLATPGRWKVYIVDEVHMLSASASNALLKTLEEPPDHVVFVLATTDPQKVLPTIRSRTQHYEFHLLDSDVLTLLLADIVRDAELELPDSAVESAVRRGRGSARDALSALDQVVASGVVYDDSSLVHELVVALAERDTARALKVVQSALVSGRDAPRIAAELLEELRGQFLAAVAPGLLREGEPPAPQASQASGPAPSRGGQGFLLGPARSVRAMEVLGTALVAMRDAIDARITLEVAIVRLTHPEADDDSSALLERIERLERRIQNLGAPAGTASPPPPPPPPPVPAARPVQAADQTSQPGERLPAADAEVGSQPALGAFGAGVSSADSGVARSFGPPPPPPPPGPVDVSASPALAVSEGPTAGPSPETALPPPTRDELVAAWGDHVLSQLRPRVRAVYAVGRFLATEGATAILALPNSAHVERAGFDCDEVAEALTRYFGRPVHLRLVAETGLGAGYSAPASTSSGSRKGSEPNGDAYGAPGSKTMSAARARSEARRPGAGRPGSVRASGAQGRTGPFHNVQEDPGPDGIDDEMLDPDDLDPNAESVAVDTLSWAQDRLMEAFPGAEEV